MALFNWEEKYSVGIESIDEQHKELIDMINSLHTAMHEGKANTSIEVILDALVDYTKTHFKDEEDLFRKYAYPHLEEHILEHNKFIDTVGTFVQDFKNKKIGLSVKILDFLSDWLKDHILLSDKKYSSFLVEKLT